MTVSSSIASPVSRSVAKSASGVTNVLYFPGSVGITMPGSGLDTVIGRARDYTFSAHVAFSRLTGFHSILQFSNSDVADRNGMVVNATSLLAGYYNGSAYVSQRKVNAFADTKVFYHVGMTNISGVVKLYVGGLADFTDAVGSNLSANQKAIGYTTNGSHYLQGAMKDIRIWSTGLTPSEMASVMAGGAVQTGSLERWWPLDEGEGVIGFDHSGNGVDLDVSSASWRKIGDI